LHGKRAFVTGAASGIGLAVVRRFAVEGAQVAGFDLDKSATSPEKPMCRPRSSAPQPTSAAWTS
jgi:NAD(P)-dependent dehydrogenase (short-subunit alcohol dehydrogenase family)